MYSFVFPMDSNRLTQFAVTKRAYDQMPQIKEFVILTREKPAVSAYLKEHDLLKDVRLLPYTVERGFNPSRAFNIGVTKAKYDRIIITSPEVKPETDVLAQFDELPGENVLAQVSDETADGKREVLISSGFRSDSPAMYFLAVFNKKDIASINGWDEEFMNGYAYEDNDFGERWKRAGLPWRIADDIRAVHQYHPRTETIGGGSTVNFEQFQKNNNHGTVWVDNGMVKH